MYSAPVLPLLDALDEKTNLPLPRPRSCLSLPCEW